MKHALLVWWPIAILAGLAAYALVAGGTVLAIGRWFPEVDVQAAAGWILGLGTPAAGCASGWVMGRMTKSPAHAWITMGVTALGLMTVFGNWRAAWVLGPVSLGFGVGLRLAKKSFHAPPFLGKSA